MCQGLGIDAPTWSRVSPLLDHALDLQPRDRAAWLEALPSHDADAFHTLFELNGAKCVALLNDTFKCSEMVRWLSSAGLAFLDGHVRQVPAALQWLQSDRVEKASRGVAEWLRK